MNAIYCFRNRDREIRYVGKTRGTLAKRWAKHKFEMLNSPQHTHKLNWLRSLDKPPIIEVMEWVPDELAAERERYWIAWAREMGCDLVNGTDGGEGAPGYKHTPEALEKMRLAKLGKKRGPHSREHREKIGAAQRGEKHHNFGKKLSPVSIEKRSAKIRGQKRSEEFCKRIGDVHRGKKHSPEARAKMSNSHTGLVQTPETVAKRLATRKRNKDARGEK